MDSSNHNVLSVDRLSHASPRMVLWVCCVASLSALAANASPVLWDLRNVSFTDGGAASGSFLYDSANQTVLDWNVFSSPVGSFSGFSYTPATSASRGGLGNCSIGFFALPNTLQSICLNPDSPLVAGATPTLLPSSRESSSVGQRAVATGKLEDPPVGGGEAVPEPNSWTLLVLPLITTVILQLVSTRRKRIKSRVPSFPA